MYKKGTRVRNRIIRVTAIGEEKALHRLLFYMETRDNGMAEKGWVKALDLGEETVRINDFEFVETHELPTTSSLAPSSVLTDKEIRQGKGRHR